MGYSYLGGPDLHCIMFYPAFLGEDLSEFLLSYGDHVAFLIIDDRAGTGSAFIQSHDVF